MTFTLKKVFTTGIATIWLITSLLVAGNSPDNLNNAPGSSPGAPLAPTAAPTMSLTSPSQTPSVAIAAPAAQATSYSSEIKRRLETVGLSGNWTKKLGWLQEAVRYDTELVGLQKEILTLRQQTYEPKIRKINDSLQSYKSSADEGSRGLYSAISQLQNEVDECLNWLSEVTKKADTENLRQEARYKTYEAEEQISEYKDKLAQLKMDVGFVEDLQKAFENRVSTLDGYIEKTRDIVSAAKAKVEEIFTVFDHEKARELAYYVKGLCDNMRKIYQYVKEDALKLFDTEQTSLSQEIDKLNSEITKIREAFNKVKAEVNDAARLISSASLQSTTTLEKVEAVAKQGTTNDKQSGQAQEGKDASNATPINNKANLSSWLQNLWKDVKSFFQGLISLVF